MNALAEKLLGRLPIGWKQLVFHRTRFVTAIGGVAFANVLIFMQLGFMNALFESSVVIHNRFDADIVLVSSDYLSMRESNPLPDSRRMEALGTTGVADANSIFLGTISWIDQESGETSNLRVIGVDPDSKAFLSDSMREGLPALQETGTAILDRLMRDFHESAETEIRDKGYFDIETNGRTTRIVGLFELGASFDVDGSIIVSDQTFFRLFPNRSASSPNIVLVHCLPGHDPDVVAKAIEETFAERDARAWTKADFIARELNYQLKVSPIGFVFGFGVAMGIVVGLMIVSQVLTSDVQDHLAEYATLKAIGYRTNYFVGIVFEQAVCLSTLGFVPGLAIALVLYALMAGATELPISMTWTRTAFVFFLTVAMCSISGTLAARKLKSADPAELF
jgi:putative ABC transport system permease protein